MTKKRRQQGPNNYCVLILFGDGWGYLNRGQNNFNQIVEIILDILSKTSTPSK